MLSVENVDTVLADSKKRNPMFWQPHRRINTGGLISNRHASHAVNITAIEPDIEAPISLSS